MQNAHYSSKAVHTYMSVLGIEVQAKLSASDFGPPSLFLFFRNSDSAQRTQPILIVKLFTNGPILGKLHLSDFYKKFFCAWCLVALSLTLCPHICSLYFGNSWRMKTN